MGRILLKIDSLFDSLEARKPARLWLECLLISFGIYLLANFLYSQNWYFMIRNDFMIGKRIGYFWEFKENLFNADLSADPVLVYRFILPYLHHYLGIGKAGSILLTLLIDMLALSVFYAAMRTRFTTKVSTVIAILVAFSFHTVGHRLMGFTDSFSHLMAAVCMLSANPVVWVFSLLASFCNDERTIVTLPFVYLWHVYPVINFKGLFKKWNLIVAASASLMIYLLIRVYISQNLVSEPPSTLAIAYEYVIENLKPWVKSWSRFFVNIFVTFRWGWIIIAIGMYSIRKAGYRFDAMLLTTLVILGAFSPILVGDVSRSVAYIFPVMGISFLAIDFERRKNTVYYILLALLATPVFYLYDWGLQENGLPKAIVSLPFPLDLYRILSGN
jgi:hypothetical protein